MKRSTRIVSVSLLLFNALSAIYGGGSLILDPTGVMLHLPIELLEPSPFSDFLVPGIILFTLNGIFDLIAAMVGLMRNKLFPELTIVAGVILTLWLTTQIIMIQQLFPPAHVPYYLVGFSLILLGVNLKKQQRIQGGSRN